MTDQISNTIRTSIVLLGILTVILYFQFDINAIINQHRMIFDSVSIISLSILLLLCWKYQHSTVFYWSITLLVSCLSVLIFENLATTKLNSEYMIALSLLLPLNFIFIRFWSLKSLFSKSSFVLFCVISLQIIAIVNLSPQYPFLIENIFKIRLIAAIDFLPSHISQLSLLLFLTAILIQIGYFLKRKDLIESTLFLSLLSIGALFYISPSHHILIISVFFSSAILIFSIIQRLFHTTYIDTLTKLPNRRAMDIELKNLGRHYVIARLDVDHMNKVNDKHGNQVVDQLLRMIAKHIRRVGGGGKPAIFDSKTFVIIFPDKSLQEILPLLDAIRNDIADEPFAIRDFKRPKDLPKIRTKKNKPVNAMVVSVSIGAAERNRAAKKVQEVLTAANEALSYAKKQGSNRVCH